MKIFISVVCVLCLLVVLNFLSGYTNSRVLMKRKRDKKIKEFESAGYKVSKRWDCNTMTIAIDEEKKVIACVVFGLTSKVFTINISDIIGEPELKVVGVIPKFTTNVCVVFRFKDNQFYFLRTLMIKKGFGVLTNSNITKRAVKNAEEILETLKKCR